MRDDLIDEEEVEESKALAAEEAKWAKEYFEKWPALAARAAVETIDRAMVKTISMDFEDVEKSYLRFLQQSSQKSPQDIEDLAAKWEQDFRAAHPELEGLISAGILVLDGKANIGYPGGDLIFNASGGLICHGGCIKPWGGPPNHLTSCPIFRLMVTGTMCSACPDPSCRGCGPSPATPAPFPSGCSVCGNPYSNGPWCIGCRPSGGPSARVVHGACGTVHSPLMACPSQTSAPPPNPAPKCQGTCCQPKVPNVPYPAPANAYVPPTVGPTRKFCIGQCIAMWGFPGDHQVGCQFGQFGPSAIRSAPKPIDKKAAAGWKGHEYYGYDSDVD
jgi:hypothetical protein